MNNCFLVFYFQTFLEEKTWVRHKKAQIETAKYLKILAENAQNQKENSQNQI